METFLIVLNILTLLVLIGALYWMQRKHFSFTKRVFAGLGLGVLFGAVLQLVYTANSDIVSKTSDWFNLVGFGYVRLLQMMVIPLIMVSIISAIMNLKGGRNLGKMSGLIIAVLILTTGIAAAVGIGASFAFDLSAERIQAGAAEHEQNALLQEKLGTVEDLPLARQILEFIPANPFADMTGARKSSTIAVVIFSAFIGIAVLGLDRKQPEQAETFRGMIRALYGVVMRIVTLILRLTPYGILALMAKTIASTDWRVILDLLDFVLASYTALIVMFIIHLLLLLGFGFNPVTYVRKALPVLTFAFTARSSAASIPLNVQTQNKRFGVQEGIANLSASFGATMGQNGCAGIYPAMLAVMTAPTAGINPADWTFILTLIVVVMISSFGVAGVGGGATFASLIVLSTLNLPVALVGLLIAVEPLIDMGRTALNVSDSMTSGLITGKVMKEVDTSVYNDRSQELDMMQT